MVNVLASSSSAMSSAISKMPGAHAVQGGGWMGKKENTKPKRANGVSKSSHHRLSQNQKGSLHNIPGGFATKQPPCALRRKHNGRKCMRPATPHGNIPMCDCSTLCSSMLVITVLGDVHLADRFLHAEAEPHAVAHFKTIAET